MDIINELWLHSVCKFEPEQVEKTVAIFDRPHNGFSSGAKEIRALKEAGMSDDFARRISDPAFYDEAGRIKEYCDKNRIRIITQDSPEYPVLLKHIKTPPRILFAKGEKIDLNDNLFVSVVGSRKPTDLGKNAARQIGSSLGKSGIVVVSGMAEGIDAEAHRGALDGGGKTVAVLAGSVDTIYPASNKKLYFEILKNGTVISERPPGTVVRPYFYQQRNRIVVGLSEGAVFVEGEIDGGTGITARLAVDNNRDIFAVPGNPLLWQSELPNSMIADGAMIVDKIDRPVEFYKETQPRFFEKINRKQAETPKKSGNLSEEDEKILDYLWNNGGTANYEVLAANCRIAPNVLGSRLIMLSIRGYLRQESGNRYVLVKRD